MLSTIAIFVCVCKYVCVSASVCLSDFLCVCVIAYVKRQGYLLHGKRCVYLFTINSESIIHSFMLRLECDGEQGCGQAVCTH